MKVLVSTNPRIGNLMLSGVYNELVWASDNLETVAHYYEGCVLEIDVVLDASVRMSYVSDTEDRNSLGLRPEQYTYGFAEMRCPAGATWYSFSGTYLVKHVRSIKEVYPDLSPWQDE